jgi:FKBP-type peptidyl-prolyl cis-trans isomerase
MKFKFHRASFLAGLMALSATAQNPPPSAALPDSAPPGQRKISYALGMNLGLQIKNIGADVDVNIIEEALRDVLDGKPARVPESELRPIFKQEELAGRAKLSAMNRAGGEAFPAKNARLQGVIVLPDGPQYRVLKAGAGDRPKSNDTAPVTVGK